MENKESGLKKACRIINILTIIFYLFIGITFLVFAIYFSSNYDGLVQAAIEKGIAKTLDDARNFATGILVLCYVLGFLASLPITMCILANRSIKKATSKDSLFTITLFNIVLGNLVGGILMILIPKEDFINQ